MKENIEYSSFERFVRISLDDGKANALSSELIQLLMSALDRAESEEKVVIIGGRDGKFSAGFDLNEITAGETCKKRLVRAGAELSLKILDLNVPVVLAVSGHALAMGALLLLAADYRIGVHGNYRIGLNEVAIGMTMPQFGVELARGKLDKAFLGMSVNLGKVYPPEEAITAGFLDEAVESSQLTIRASTVASALSELNMKAYLETKKRAQRELVRRVENAIQAGL